MVIAFTGLAMNYLVSHAYGAEGVGRYAVYNSIVILLSILGTVGLNVYLIRVLGLFKKRYPQVSINSIYDKAIVIVTTTTSMCLLVGFLFRDQIDNLFSKSDGSETIIIIAFVAVIPQALYELVQAYYKHVIKNEVILRCQLVQSGVKIISVLFASFLLLEFIHFLILFVLSLSLVSIYAIISSKIDMRKAEKGKRYDFGIYKIKTLISESSPFLITSSATLLITHFGFLIMGNYLGLSQIGYFSVATKLALLISFAMKSINSTSASLFSKYHLNEDLYKLKVTLKRTSNLSFLFAFPLGLTYLVAGKFLLGLFGSEYIEAFTSLMVLSLAQIFSSLCGSVGFFLNMTGNEKSFRNIIIVSAIANICFNLILIPRFGILGSASAAAFSIVFNNVAALMVVKKKFGYWSIGFLRS